MPDDLTRTLTSCKKPTGARFFVCWAFLAAGSTVPSHARAAEPLDELAATRRLCASGPAAAIARAQRLRGSAEVASAGVLPNPMLAVEHQRSLSGSTDRETVIGVSVPLGIAGRRWLLQDAAARREDQARADAHGTLFDAALAFREAYARAASEQGRVELLHEQQKTLDELATVIRGLTQGGETAGYDLLRQQTQARLHQSSVDTARARALASRARLEAWADGEVAVLPLGPARPSVLPPLSGSYETPSMRSLRAASQAAALEARAARRRWLPDLDVFAGYRQVSSGQDSGHGVSLGLTLPLTVLDRGQGEAARADAERELALAVLVKLRRDQRAELKAARLRLEGLGAAIAQAEQAAVQAAEVQSKARQLYAAGEATITEVLDAFRGLEEARLVRLAILEEISEARLALMRAAGSMFDASLDRACGEPSPGKRR